MDEWFMNSVSLAFLAVSQLSTYFAIVAFDQSPQYNYCIYLPAEPAVCPTVTFRFDVLLSKPVLYLNIVGLL